MKKWLDKYEIPEAQNGIEGTMGGLTDKGFNYSPAWGGAWRDGGILQPPMAGANQTLPMYAMGGNIPGAVGFTYARTQGIPSEGPYGKKTVPSAQNGASIPVIEDVGDFKDGVWVPNWKAMAAQAKKLGAKKVKTKSGSVIYFNDNWEVTGANDNPKAQNGQEMRFYQEGLDWTPKNISEYGSEIHKAQVGDDIPWYMRKSSDISQRGNQKLKTEIATQKTKEKKAQEARTRTTIGADTRTAKQKEKDRQAYEDRVKYEEEVLGRDFTMPTSLQERNREQSERIIHNLVDVPLTLMPVGELAYLGGKGIVNVAPKVGEYLTTQTPLRNAYKINPWAFKPNEANWYRQVGKSAIDDAFQTGLIREAGEEVSPRMFQEFQDQLSRMQSPGLDAMLSSRRPASPFFGKGELFYPMGRKPIITKAGKLSKNPAGKGSADYLIETSLPNEAFQPAYVKGMGLGVPTEIGQTAILKPNPSLRNLENFNIYKQDWLRGYKQVPKPTSVSSSVDNFTSTNYPSFKTITGNPEYIDEAHLSNLIKRETDWLRSPEYIKRKMAATGKSEEAIRKESEKIINNINNTSIKYTGKSENWASGLYSPGNKPTISIFNGNVDYPFYEGVLDHEVKHAFSEMGNPGDDIIRFFKNEGYRNYPKVNLNKTIKDRLSSAFEQNWVNHPTEQQVIGRRIMDIIEETQGLKRGTELTENNIKELINNLKKDKYNTANGDVFTLMSAYKRKFGKDYPKQLVEFLNKAYVVPGIGGAGILGAGALQQQKRGGVVKGKEGIAVNKADEYPLQKLDDLLNFTNYNKPKAKSGGWLDKYN
jgi:hypothetical protein